MYVIFRPLCAILMIMASAAVSAQAMDAERQIRSIAANWERAWNTHNMKALGALVTIDADFVNVGGKHWKGREDIEAEHTRRLSQFEASTWTTKQVTVQLLKLDLALVHVNWGIAGDKDPDGAARQPREGIFTWIVVQGGDGWRIRAAQNTNISNLQPAEHPAGDKNSNR